MQVRSGADVGTVQHQDQRRSRYLRLEPGQTRTVSFTLGEQDLAFYDSAMVRVVEPGGFRVFVGTSSDDVSRAARFVLGGEVRRVPLECR